MEKKKNRTDNAQALTRAIYSRLPMVILDDVMSGLDARTANLVTGSLFGPEGHFRKAGISVVLATHSRMCPMSLSGDRTQDHTDHVTY